MYSKFSLAFAFVLATGSAAIAASTGEEIRAAVSDATISGNMDSSGAYAEFYQADGTIKGKDYTGSWTIEGNAMCFVYQGTPKDCYEVEVNGDQVRWLKEGKSLGTGTIVKGNANSF